MGAIPRLFSTSFDSPMFFTWAVLIRSLVKWRFPCCLPPGAMNVRLLKLPSVELSAYYPSLMDDRQGVVRTAMLTCSYKFKGAFNKNASGWPLLSKISSAFFGLS